MLNAFEFLSADNAIPKFIVDPGFAAKAGFAVIRAKFGTSLKSLIRFPAPRTTRLSIDWLAEFHFLSVLPMPLDSDG